MLYWATSRCCKCQSCCSKCQNPCAQMLCSGAPVGGIFPMVLLATRHRCPAWQFLPDGALRRRRHYAAVHLHLCHGASTSNKPHSARPASLFATAPWLVSPPRRPGQQHFPDGALPRRRLSQGTPPRRPGQQQTSFGGEKYSGLASNLTHLGRIC